MDANESKFEGKLQDGKHLELNMAKTAFKQIFYTNAQVLASLGIITIFACPSWLSYHGISVDKIASKSEFLISPYMCAKVIINYIKNLDIEDLYLKKKYIHDTTFYQCVNSLDLSKVNLELVYEEKPIDKLVNLSNENEIEEPYVELSEDYEYYDDENEDDEYGEDDEDDKDIEYKVEENPKRKKNT
jgi:hypothetical protein